MSERLIALAFGAVCLLLVIGAIAIIWSSVRRARAGDATITERGWRRLPTGSDVTSGWVGWPFIEGVEPGNATDIVVGEHRGVELMTLRWRQKEHRRGGEDGPDAFDEYNIVALRTEVAYPPLSIVRGKRSVHPWQQHPGMEAFSTGDEHFDRRWQVLGDADFGRALLTPQVRAAIDERDDAWAFQPGWVTRVTPWTFYAGEERAITEVETMIAPLRSVPVDVWERYGGPPRFIQQP